MVWTDLRIGFRMLGLTLQCGGIALVFASTFCTSDDGSKEIHILGSRLKALESRSLFRWDQARTVPNSLVSEKGSALVASIKATGSQGLKAAKGYAWPIGR